MSELPATPLGGVRLAGDPPVTSDVPAPPKAVIAEGVMPLPASAPAVPAAPAPEPPAEGATLPVESLLLRFRMITPAQLADAMKEEAVSGKSVATIVVEGGRGALFTITLFEDQASLISALPLADGWSAEHRGTLEPGATEVAIGEVLAQKGL